MEPMKKKSPYGLTRDQEQAASRFFGRHVSGAKALVCVIAASLCCALPMLLGLRLWEKIPPLVETGLITADGRDDSLPRAVLVFGLPGLFALLSLICHGQLWLHQKTGRIPPTPVRLLGRWTLPVLSVLLNSFWILRAADENADAAFFLPSVLGLLLLLTGAHFFDCKRESRAAFHLKCIEYKEAAWRGTHRAAGLAWMAAGLLLLGLRLGLGRLPLLSAIPILLLLLAPLPAAKYFGHSE